MLGELVNVVARYTSEHVGNYMRDIRTPAFKLLGLYGLQVRRLHLRLLSTAMYNSAQVVHSTLSTYKHLLNNISATAVKEKVQG